MDKKIKGSWLIHHTNKLQGFDGQAGYENIYLAGKAGILLSAISAEKQADIDKGRLDVLADAARINKVFELPKLIDVLKERKLVDTSKDGISVLGVTSAMTLEHISDLFDSLEPNPNEVASIALSECASIAPVLKTEVSNELADEYKLASDGLEQLFSDAEQIGFVDLEKIDSSQELLFNGNLFRRDSAEKIKRVLDALKPIEQDHLNNFIAKLRKQACISKISAEEILGADLLQKVLAIGLFDISTVSNSNEEVSFLTLPSAFSKYSNSMVDDALDLAKAFVSSITYGMTKSNYERGQIQMVVALLTALVNGESVGPVRAIAEDYKVLELKGVVEVKRGTKKRRTGPMLRLLKKEVGELALQAIQKGDVSEHSLTALPTAAVTIFKGPEHNREKIRRQQLRSSAKSTNDMLSVLRRGGGL